MTSAALPDPWTEIFGSDLDPVRRDEVLSTFAGVLAEIEKLRALDLTDVHPCVIFEPTAPYRLHRED
jgi:hypothetical protein